MQRSIVLAATILMLLALVFLVTVGQTGNLPSPFDILTPYLPDLRFIYLGIAAALLIVAVLLIFASPFRSAAFQALIALCFLAYSLIEFFAKQCQIYGIRDMTVDASNSESIVKNARVCRYFSIITWTTVGFGDFIPTPEDRVWVQIEALSQYFVMGLLIAALVTLISRNKAQ